MTTPLPLEGTPDVPAPPRGVDRDASALSLRDRTALLVEAVLAGVRRNDPAAVETLRAWAGRGAREHLKRQEKNGHDLVVLDPDGKAVRLTASQALRIDEDGRAVWEQVSLWDCTADQLAQLRLASLRRAATEQFKVTVITEMLNVMARHPECKTAGDAWAADGRDDFDHVTIPAVEARKALP